MAQYIVSARKYRPDSFENLIGQDNIARTLKNSIIRGQLAHAYLFCGPRGVGKTSAARIFAKTINCAHPSADMEPCGECESCVSFREGRSYCIHELDAASNNGVEDIKALMEQVQIPPQVGKYSVYIIDEVHMLTQSAFNAFLKTLEEPPSHAIFILATTEKHKIIPTILSRCQTYDFNRISVPDIVRNLRDIAGKEGVKVDDESLHVIAHKADGAMRDALTIFDQTVAFCGADIHYEDVIRNLNVLDYEYSFRLVDAFLAKDYGSALLIFDEILSKGFNALHFVSALGAHLRDLLVSRTGGLEALLDLPASLQERYREQAGRCTLKFLYEALGVLSQCEAGYRAATNQRLHIEFALMRLAFLGGVPAEESRPATLAATIPLRPQGTGEGSPETPSVAPSGLHNPGRTVTADSASRALPPKDFASLIPPTAEAAGPSHLSEMISPPAAPQGASAFRGGHGRPRSSEATPAFATSVEVATKSMTEAPDVSRGGVSGESAGFPATKSMTEAPDVSRGGVVSPVAPSRDASAVTEGPATASPLATIPLHPQGTGGVPPETPCRASLLAISAAGSGLRPSNAEPSSPSPAISRDGGIKTAESDPKPAAQRKRPAGLSLSSLMSDEEVTVELAQDEESAQPLPDPEEMKAKWPELAAMYEAQPRLRNALATARLETREEDGRLILSFALVSEAQRSWIAEKKLRELEERFQKLAGSPKVRLEPGVLPEEHHEDKKYMPVEKAQDLMSKNPEVGALIKDLSLDIR